MSEPEVEAGTEILNREGGRPGSDIHSWRCADKERHPEPCTCSEEVVAEILAAVLPSHDRRLLLALADDWHKHWPERPLKPSDATWVIDWLRHKAEGVESE